MIKGLRPLILTLPRAVGEMWMTLSPATSFNHPNHRPGFFVIAGAIACAGIGRMVALDQTARLWRYTATQCQRPDSYGEEIRGWQT